MMAGSRGLAWAAPRLAGRTPPQPLTALLGTLGPDHPETRQEPTGLPPPRPSTAARHSHADDEPQDLELFSGTEVVTPPGAGPGLPAPRPWSPAPRARSRVGQCCSSRAGFGADPAA